MKNELTPIELKRKIGYSLSSRGQTKIAFAKELIKERGRYLTSEKPETIVAMLSLSGPISFPLLTVCYEYLNLGKLTKDEKIIHRKETTYYVEEN